MTNLPPHSFKTLKPSSQKIVFFLNSAWHFRIHWLDRAKQLQKMGLQVCAILPDEQPEEIQSIRQNGIPVFEIRMTRKKALIWQEINTLFQLTQLLFQLSPDLIHAVTHKPNLYSIFLGRLFKKPVVVTICGLGRLLPIFPVDHMAWILQKSYRLLSNYSQLRVITEHQGDKTFLRQNKIMPAHQVQVVRGTGINPAEFSASPFPPTSPLKVLFASRMLWIKGADIAVEVVDKLKSEGHAVELIMAGIHMGHNDPDYIPIETVEQWHQEGKVEWLGYRHDMANLINQVHVVILPTQYPEGIPRILIESACCGRVSIATDLPGCRDIIRPQETGILVPEATVGNFATALKDVVENWETYQSMGFKAKDDVSKRFTHQHVFPELLSVYQGFGLVEESVRVDAKD